MKTTGVVRRIDDLGRIVIPKEIRKNLRIKDGESLEIFLDSDSIILKKYSRLEDLNDFYKTYVDSIQSAMGGNVMIVDNDKFIAISGNLKRKYLDASISNYIENVIKKRELALSSEKTSLELSSSSYEQCCYVISPIISDGDAIGAVIILNDTFTTDNFYETTARIASKFLGKYVE